VIAGVAVAKDVDTVRQLDFAVNNAGYEGPVAGIWGFCEEHWEEGLNIIPKGFSLSMRHEARAISAARRSRPALDLCRRSDVGLILCAKRLARKWCGAAQMQTTVR
jgi:NAD(P)-dependent dehydrogenase (short-subunit alcohol dehydrogenase family)